MSEEAPDILTEAMIDAIMLAAPDSWLEIRVEYRELAQLSEIIGTAYVEDVGIQYIKDFPTQALEAFHALRESLSRQGNGAWYTAYLSITANGMYVCRYDYDNEPTWESPVPPGIYAQDLAHFPREEYVRPAWLRVKLGEINEPAAEQLPPERFLEETREITGKLYNDIATGLSLVAPPDWRELRSIFVQAGRMSETESIAFLDNGSRVSFGDTPAKVYRAFKDLRRLLFEWGQGAWYTAYATLSEGGNLHVEYDYDEEPEWSTSVVPATYAEDVALFPRPEDRQPDWLRERVAEAVAAGQARRQGGVVTMVDDGPGNQHPAE